MIHFWELPENRNYILLKEDFKNNIIENLKDKNLLNRQFRKIKNQKIRIKTIKNIVNLLNLDLDLVERNIVWIGGSNSKGLHNPILPINIKGRAFARFIAGIMNDGCLTKENKNSYGRLMYDNFDKTLMGSKWQKAWEENKIFEAKPGKNKKFFFTTPYPYISGSLHVGHGRAVTESDILCRYKRMVGFNVLFPMAFHISGTPVL